MGEYCEEADYKIKLYTVLSAHRPNEVQLTEDPDAVPNWETLEQLMMARFPDKDDINDLSSSTFTSLS